MINTKVNSYQIVEAILYRLNTGYQWRELPTKQFFKGIYSLKGVYYHYQKWCKDGSWGRIWQFLFHRYRYSLDMSSIRLNETHTPVIRNGQAVAYQGKKKAKTSNMLILNDSWEMPLACSDPIEDNHNNTFELVPTAKKMLSAMQSSGIAIDGLSLKVDARFDTSDFQAYCSQQEIVDNIVFNLRNEDKNEQLLDQLLYEFRFIIERTNAWLDTFKAIIMRFEINAVNWKALNIMVFCIILLRQL